MVERIGAREARQRFAELVDRAQRGERIVVTRDGLPVAQMGPLDPGDDRTTLDDLVARGLVERPRRDDRPRPTFTMPVWAGTRLDRIVREVRGR